MDKTYSDDPAAATPDEAYYGLTKREAFAGMAMSALLKSLGADAMDDHKVTDHVAGVAVECADALVVKLNEIEAPDVRPGDDEDAEDDESEPDDAA